MSKWQSDVQASLSRTVRFTSRLGPARKYRAFFSFTTEDKLSAFLCALFILGGESVFCQAAPARMIADVLCRV